MTLPILRMYGITFHMLALVKNWHVEILMFLAHKSFDIENNPLTYLISFPLSRFEETEA